MTYASQAIVTKYLGPTNSKPSRIKATVEAKSITVSYHIGESEPDLGPHIRAARALALEMNWNGQWYIGALPHSGYVFVNSDDGIPCFATSAKEKSK